MHHTHRVVVDGLAIVGAYAAVGHPIVDGLEATFLRQHVWYEEHSCAVHVRWGFILEHIPAMRSRHLYQDLRDIYEWAEKLPSGRPLICAYDLAILQHRFWDVLAANNMTMPHCYGWQICAAQGWQNRLIARVTAQKPWRRSKIGKVRKPVVVPATPGKWYN